MSELLSNASLKTGYAVADQLAVILDKVKAIMGKMNNEPISLTAEEARFLSEHSTVHDERARPSHAQTSHRSLLTAVNNLHAAVDDSPEEVTTEAIRTVQSIISKMRKVIGQAELQEETAKVEPKIAQGTVTKAEADHLRSLEARAHGHTEKGGIAATAQSVAAKRERRLSLSGDSKGTLSPQEQSHHDKEENLRQAEAAIRPKIEDGTVTKAEAKKLQSREMRAHGHTEKGGLSATAHSIVAKRHQEAFSDVSNSKSPTSAEAGHLKEETLVEGNLVDDPKTEKESS